jgi:hypothetical protein
MHDTLQIWFFDNFSGFFCGGGGRCCRVGRKTVTESTFRPTSAEGYVVYFHHIIRLTA